MNSVKRGIDLVLSSCGMVAFLPLWVLIPILIRIDSPGPAIIRQQRIGRHGRPFTLYKFRSMKAVEPGAHAPQITAADDPRVTGVGSVLRRSKLDELPQLWNVLLGEMSLVGPRPELAAYVAGYSDAQREVLEHRPGLVDPATLAYLDEESVLARFDDPETAYVREILPHKLSLAIEYARTATPWSDLTLLLRTGALLLLPERCQQRRD